MNIRPASEATRVLALLRDCGLPTGDLRPEQFPTFLVCGSGSRPGGVVGLEVHGACGLLRSLAVSEEARGTGCGSALVAAIEEQARVRGVVDLFLLTETAEGFFAARGYVGVSRDAVPGAIRRTTEFSSLCPDSAAVMRKSLVSAES